ncbi:LuxR family transcriptional regulator HyxR [Escherichia coli]
MKKPLVIISACQFTRLALESLIPTDRYIVRVYSNVTTEVEFVLKTSCGYLLADIPSLPSGELVLLACLARLRSDAGQWQVCLTGDSDWFDNAPAASLYNGFPRIGTMLTASRYQNQIIRWLLRPLPGDMSDFWLLTARELSVLKILMQGMSFSEIARYEQRSSKTLHAIATRALMKLGLGTLSDFRLLYTGCGDSRVKRNIRLHAKYIGQHSTHRLTQYVQNMVSGILYPEKVAVGESINSDAISGKVLSGQRKNMSKKRPGLL